MSSIANLTRQSGRLVPQTVKQVACLSTSSKKDAPADVSLKNSSKWLRLNTPIWKELSRYPYQEPKELRPWPKGINPYTGEGGGPTGPEPTRYGDWERRGRCSDF